MSFARSGLTARSPVLRPNPSTPLRNPPINPPSTSASATIGGEGRFGLLSELEESVDRPGSRASQGTTLSAKERISQANEKIRDQEAEIRELRQQVEDLNKVYDETGTERYSNVTTRGRRSQLPEQGQLSSSVPTLSTVNAPAEQTRPSTVEVLALPTDAPTTQSQARQGYSFDNRSYVPPEDRAQFVPLDTNLTSQSGDQNTGIPTIQQPTPTVQQPTAPTVQQPSAATVQQPTPAGETYQTAGLPQSSYQIPANASGRITESHGQSIGKRASFTPYGPVEAPAAQATHSAPALPAGWTNLPQYPTNYQNPYYYAAPISNMPPPSQIPHYTAFQYNPQESIRLSNAWNQYTFRSSNKYPWKFWRFRRTWWPGRTWGPRRTWWSKWSRRRWWPRRSVQQPQLQSKPSRRHL